MDAAFIGTLFAWSNAAAVFGLNLFIHTSVVILAGLAGAFVLTRTRKGAASLSLVYRMTLCAVLATPILMPAIFSLDLDRFYLAVRLPSPRSQADGNAAMTVPVSPIPADPSRTAALPEHASSPATVMPDSAEPPSSETPQAPAAMTPSSPPSPADANPPARAHLIAYTGPSLCALWVFLSLFLFIRASVILAYVRRIRKLAVPARPEYAGICREVARELGTDVPDILQSPYVTSTFITGIIRPAVLLPLGANESSMASREVFFHELAHLIRRDHIWLLAGQAVKIFFPLQPLLWILMRRLEEAHDYACDNYVLNHTGEDRAYAARLFDLALSIRPGGVGDVAGAGILTSKSPLRRRIEHILDNSYARHIAPKANETMSMALLFVCAVTLTGFVGIRSEAATEMSATYGHGGKSSTKHFPLRIPVFVSAAETPPAETPVPDTTPPVRESIAQTIIEPTPDASPVSGLSTGTEALPTPEAEIAGDIVRNGETPVVTDTITESIAEILPIQHSAPAPRLAASFSGAPASGNIDRRSAAHPAAETAAAQVLPPSFIGFQTAMTGGTEIVAAKPGPLSVTIPPDAPDALRESLESGQENPVWSPNGKFIAFTGHGGNGIWAVKVSGGKPELVYDTTPDNPATALSSSARILSFSPAGDALAYMRYMSVTPNGGADKTAAVNAVFTQAIETVNLLTGERRVLVKSATDGCWSPDGRLFAYVEGDGYGIRILDTRTGETKPLTEAGSWPTFTPDGASLIYTSWGGGIFDQLYRIPIAGGKPEQLTDEGYWLNPRCSPDGEWVLCSGYQNGGSSSCTQLRAFNLRDRTTHDVYFVKTSAAKMGTWSPSGRQYCFTLTDKASAQEESVLRSAIYIGDFPIDNILDSMGASAARPAEFKLIGNFPNPFNMVTAIRFSIPREGLVELVIYAMNGQKVRDLASRKMSAGTHTIQWDGRDQYGKKVSSGVYISRLKMEREVETRRMTLLK